MTTVRLEAPAKLNLRLVVLAREASGYHSLETIFCGVSLCDTIVVAEGERGIDLRISGGIDVGPPEANLALRAAARFYREIGADPHVTIAVEKRIPAGAGLGGGSSDAAATLRALNLLHDLPFTEQELLGWSPGLGSDVPFFLGRRPFALAWGRGERLLDLEPPPVRPLLIAYPGVAVATAEVFSTLARTRGTTQKDPEGEAFAAEELSDWSTLSALAQNDLEAVARTYVPSIADAVAAMDRGGAIFGLMSGSGSAVFGVFDDREARDAAEPDLIRLGFATQRCETLRAWPLATVGIDPSSREG